jgi:thioredoxin-related protein
MTRFWCASLSLAAAACFSSGCVEFRWKENVERADQQAKTEGKYLFVFYKWWLSNDSNRMETDVLRQPDVARLFQNTINCRIVYEYPPNREYMAKHGVDRTPGFLIQAPDGSYQKLVGYVPEEAFIKWAQAAMTKNPERPAKPPPITPTRAP